MPFDDPPLPVLLIESDPTPPPTPPAAPTGLTANPGLGEVVLDWDDNPEPGVTYAVYIASSATGPWTLVDETAVSTYTVTGLLASTTYWFRVTAEDGSGNVSDPSTSVSATTDTPTVDTTPPAAPTGLGAVGGAGQITLDWNNNGEGDLASYRVKRGTVTGGPYTTVASPTASAYVDTGLAASTTYFYVVTAVDTSGNESSNSAQASATTNASADVTAPDVPTGLTATAGNTQITLNWTDNTEDDFDHYLVYRATASGGPYTQIASRTVSSYTNTGLTNGTTYWFKVSAVDTSGNESAQSGAVSSTPVGSPVPPSPGLPTPDVIFNSGNPYTTTKVNNEAAGTVFQFTVTGGDGNGPVYRTTIPTKSGNRYRFDAGTRLDGEFTRQLAFAAGPSNVWLYDCEWTGYIGVDAKGVPDNTGASAIRAAAGWRVYRPYGHDNKWSAFGFQGSGIYMEGGRLSWNGQLGFGNGSSNCEINGTEVDHNGHHSYAGQSNLTGNSGGCKIATSTNFTARNVHSHHNYAAGSADNQAKGGHGLWADINNGGTLFDNCNIHDNEGFGIFWEVSLDFEIKNSTIQNNGVDLAAATTYPYGAQIFISNGGGDLGWIHNNTINVGGSLGFAGIGMVNQAGHPQWTAGNISKGCLGTRNILIENNSFNFSGSQWQEIMAITGGLATVRSADQWCGQVEAWAAGSNIIIRNNSITRSGGKFPTVPYVRDGSRISAAAWAGFGYS